MSNLFNNRTPSEISDMIFTFSEFITLRKMLIDKNCLGLRILWNINLMKRYSHTKDIEKWVKHRFGIQKRSTKKRYSLIAQEIIHNLANYGLIKSYQHKPAKNNKGYQGIFPKTKTIRIILNTDPLAKLESFDNFSSV